MSGPPAGFVAGQVEVVWLSGPDRLAFLERMSTNRLADLAPGAGRATALLTDTGRVVDLVACHAGEAGTVLTTSGPGAAAAVTTQLRRYILHNDRVRVTDAAAQVAVLRLLGPAAGDVARQVTGLDLADLPPGSWRVGTWAGEEAWALCQPTPGGLGGVDLVTPQGAASAALVAAVEAAGMRGLRPEAYALWRIDTGLPAFGAEIDGRANPLELDLRPVVDFAKGCYIGQEVVARLAAYDKVQRCLVRLETGGPTERGDVVGLTAAPARSGRADTGRITTVAPAGPGRWLALALVPTAWPPGAPLTVVSASGPTPAGRATGDQGTP